MKGFSPAELPEGGGRALPAGRCAGEGPSQALRDCVSLYFSIIFFFL